MFLFFHKSSNGRFMSDIITVNNLVMVYSDGTKAVEDISFNVREGEFFGFLGPNGAGKSTTIKILTTLLRKTSGSAIVAGHDLDKEPEDIRKLIGVQSQDTAVDGDLTGKENLILQGHFQQLPSHELKQRVNELLKLVELEDAADKRARNYSGGMKKRLDLATALVHRPRLLFLDEPTIGLDPQTRRRIWEYLVRVRDAEGITIFMTTHYMDEAEICDRIAVMDHGRIVACGTPDELKTASGGDVVTLGTSDDQRAVRQLVHMGLAAEVNKDSVHVKAPRGDELIPTLVRALESSAEPIRVLRASVRRPTLDDVFMQLTGRTIRDEGADDLDKVRQRMTMRMRM